MKENRRLACAVLVLCILFSVLALGGISLNRQRSKVLDIYATGVMHDELSAKVYLNLRGTEGQKLAAKAAVYLGEDDADVAALAKAAAEINEAEDIGERLRLSREIGSVQSMVYEKLVKAGMTDEDARDAKVYDRNVTDAGQKLANDAYFEYASGFNKTLRGFPAALIARVCGISALAEND